MSIEAEVQALRQVPMFRDIDKGRLKLLAFTSERVNFSAGQYIFKRGDVSDAAYVILDGEAHVLVETPTGPLKVTKFRTNDIMGEMGVLAGIPRSASIRAATDLMVLRLDKQVFLELLEQFPQISIAIMRELAHRLERTTARLAESTKSTPPHLITE